ncbi:MAG: acyl-CoA dehydrogenase family protein [Proteobacteria bacterium]|nr:acyl-CoA dehydrogenase family protein [Pseudomonadota bacterium]
MNNASPTAGGEPDYTELLTDSVADYCARALAPRRLRALHGAGHAFDRGPWREMAELGWCGLVVGRGRWRPGPRCAGGGERVP